MPFYYELKNGMEATAQGLIRLRAQLSREIPLRTLQDSLLLATWNIREFDSPKYGERDQECFYYIAEIISRFDLVAIQEVREDLEALERLKRILGSQWKHLVTDITFGTAGNGERMAYLYDERKVRFDGLAGEVVLPPDKQQAVRQFARTPYIASFRAGWVRFNLCTAHIYYGEAVADEPTRLAEIRDLATLLAEKTRATWGTRRPENLAILGDFNIFSPTDATYQAIVDAGFIIPEALQSVGGSNVDQSKYYDQIAFLGHEKRFVFTGRAGVLDFYESMYRLEDEPSFAPRIGSTYNEAVTPHKKTLAYKQWRTFQMSDHLPMWIELKIDFAEDYLARCAGGAVPT